jgi:hypothetical protein
VPLLAQTVEQIAELGLVEQITELGLGSVESVLSASSVQAFVADFLLSAPDFLFSTSVSV